MFFKKKFLSFYILFFYLFLYIPLGVLILFSFTKDAIASRFIGFTLKWYYLLFASTELWNSVKTSLLVALAAAVISLLLGVLLVHFSQKTYLKKCLIIFYSNLAIPEIMLAAGLLSLFYACSVPLGITTLIAAHVVLGLGYVIPLIVSRYDELNERLLEASADLGATEVQTFFYIIVPFLKPAIRSAALLVFIGSFDDFTLSFFCSGASVQTLPIYIFSIIRSGSSPLVNALSTILLIISSLAIVVLSSWQIKKMDIVK